MAARSAAWIPLLSTVLHALQHKIELAAAGCGIFVPCWCVGVSYGCREAVLSVLRAKPSLSSGLVADLTDQVAAEAGSCGQESIADAETQPGRSTVTLK